MTPDYFALAVRNARDQFSIADAVATLSRIDEDGAPRPSVAIDGPRQCCADAGSVIACDGETDTWECWICGRVWETPCR